MADPLESDNSSTPQQSEPDVLVLIKKMQQQLVFLEKKIDILINQSQARPSYERPFSRERSFDRGRRFEKRPGEESQGFGYKKKSYDNPRESDSGREHHFEKRHSGENRGFGQKKKPFYLGRKGSRKHG